MKLSVLFVASLLLNCFALPFEPEDRNLLEEVFYEPDIVDDYKRIDMQIQKEWEELYESILGGYGYLKMECEDELKRAVRWVTVYYENITTSYEKSLYDFEQTYIILSEDPDYEFLYDIENIFYNELDDFEQVILDSKIALEKTYWETVEALDKQQDNIESILTISESKVDDIMDETETELEKYSQNLNGEKWEVQQVEIDTSEDIDDDIVDYYEEDEEYFNEAELAAINTLQNDMTDVDDFDTAPEYVTKYEQIFSEFDETSEQL